jgi:hypothetical protein
MTGDGRCVGVDAGAVTDAGAPDARAATDASATDAATADALAANDAAPCTPNAETCDGLDNDCDLLIDEGLAMVGGPVPLGSGTAMSPALRRARIVPEGTGFGVLYDDHSPIGGLTAPAWARIDAHGTTTGSATMLASDSASGGLLAVPDGANVVLAGANSYYTINGGGHWVVQPYDLLVFDAMTAARVAPAGGGPYQFTDANPRTWIHVADAAAGRATVYAEYGTTTPVDVRRYRVSTTGGAISVLSSAVAASVSSYWNVLSAGSTDYITAASTNGLLVFETPRGDATGSTTMLGPIPGIPSDVSAGALAVRAQDEAVSAMNPLAVVLPRPAPNGILFLQLTMGSPLTAGTAITLPGAVGTGTADIIAADLAQSPGHFFIASMDYTGSGATTQTLRVWEITGEPPTARALSIVDDWAAARQPISLARASDGTIRLAETDDMGNVVTRSIGCH